MVITIPGAKVIATAHDVLVKFENSLITLQAKTEDLTVFEGAKLLVANGGTVTWSFPLGTQEVLDSFCSATGISPI